MRFLVFCIMILAIPLAGCGIRGSGPQPSGEGERQAGPAPGQPPQPPALLVPVEVEQPERRAMVSVFETQARVEAENRVEVVAQGSGECLGVMAEVGDAVAAGQVLAELEKTELEAQIAQSRVTAEQNRYQMEKAKEQLAEGLVSAYEAENARFTYEQSKASLATQLVQLKNQTIRAPIGGIISERQIQQGMVVSAGSPAFTIIDPTSYVLPINVPEKELLRVSIGQEARVSIDAQAGETIVARVSRINPTVDLQTKTVRVLLAFEEGDRALLREAGFARVALVVEERENVLTVPTDAVVEQNGRTYLMVVTDAPASPEGELDSAEGAQGAEGETGPKLVAERVEIETGLEDSGHVEVVSGIGEDARVITLGQHTLRPGTPVKVTAVEREFEAQAAPEEAGAPGD